MHMIGNLIIVTPPPVEPVSLALVKKHCRVEIDDDDDLLMLYLASARSYAENYLNRAIVRQKVSLNFDGFCASGLALRGGHVIEVASVQYYDSDGNVQTWPATSYWIGNSSEPAVLVPAIGETFPLSQSRPDAVTVTYWVGYEPGAGSPTDYGANIPASIKSAILLMVGHAYENREAVHIGGGGKAAQAFEIPLGVESLLWPYRSLR